MASQQGAIPGQCCQDRNWIASSARSIAIAFSIGLMALPSRAAELILPHDLIKEDSAFGSGTFVNKGYRMQMAFAAREFENPTNALLITELRWRPDHFYGKPFKAVVRNIQIDLSTTGRSPESLSALFAENIGKDHLEVFSGALEINSGYEGPASGPKNFDISVPLTTPFLYVPGNGNLLVDIRNLSGSPASLVAGQSVRGDGASRVSGRVTSRFGAADVGSDAIQFVYQLTNTPARPRPPLVGPNVVVPMDVANRDSVFGSGTLANAAHRSQQVYAASQFGSITGAFFVTELRFRPDHFHGFSFATVVSNLQINLSTSVRPPENLSRTFAENIGSDDTVVFHGPLEVRTGFVGPAGGPKDFDIIIPLSRGFRYDPAAGDLLVEIWNFSGSAASPLSGQAVAGDGGARILGSIHGRTGVHDSGVDAVQLVGWPTNSLPALASVRRPIRSNPTPGASGATVEVRSPVESLTAESERASRGKVYDLASDFSTQSNPTGPWRAGWKKGVIGSLTLLPQAKWHETAAGIRVFCWQMNDRESPMVQRVLASAEISSNGKSGRESAPLICLTPGSRGAPEKFAAIRFSVPQDETGDYRIEALAKERCDGVRVGKPAFHIVVNRLELFSRHLPPNGAAGYTNVIALKEGDTVDFLASRDPDGDSSGSVLSLSVTLTGYVDGERK